MQAGTDFSLPSRHSIPPDQLDRPPSPPPSAGLTSLPAPSPRVPPLCPAGMSDMRACSYPLCGGVKPNGFSLVSRVAWFAHCRLRSGRPRRPPRRAAAAGEAPAAADAASVAATAGPAGAASAAAQADLGDSGGGEGVKMRQPGAAMRLMILLQRPLSRGLRGQMACASPPMSFKTILMSSWGTTIPYSIVCHTRLWTTTCARGAHQGPVELPTPSTQWRSPASTYSRRKPIAATPAVSRSALTARISMRVMCVTPLAIACTGSPACRQPTGCCFLG